MLDRILISGRALLRVGIGQPRKHILRAQRIGVRLLVAPRLKQPGNGVR